MRRINRMPVARAIVVFFGNLDSVPEITEAVIKTQYRSLALQNHPDKGGDAVRFNEIKEAYDALMADITEAAKYHKDPEPEGPNMGSEFVDFVSGKGGDTASVFNAYHRHSSPLYEVMQYAKKLGVTLTLQMSGEHFVITHIADVPLPMAMSLGTTVEEAKTSIDEIAQRQKEHKGKSWK